MMSDLLVEFYFDFISIKHTQTRPINRLKLKALTRKTYTHLIHIHISYTHTYNLYTYASNHTHTQLIMHRINTLHIHITHSYIHIIYELIKFILIFTFTRFIITLYTPLTHPHNNHTLMLYTPTILTLSPHLHTSPS